MKLTSLSQVAKLKLNLFCCATVSTEEGSDEAGGGRLVTLYAVTEPGLIPGTTDITIHDDTMSHHHHTTDIISQQEQTTHHITDSDITTEASLGEPT